MAQNDRNRHGNPVKELRFGSEAARSHADLKQILGLDYILGGFPGGSAVKNSPASAGNADSIAGSGRSPGGGMATHSSILAWEKSMGRGAWWTVHGAARVGHD